MNTWAAADRDNRVGDDIAIPARPAVLVDLSLLLADEGGSHAAVAELVAQDMALAAAVLQAVNSSRHGLGSPVRTVQQAVTYLGTGEVAQITLELALRAAFAPQPELTPVWQRAALRAQWMGRLARALDIDASVAHSAGLFAECGKAVLLRHVPQHHRAMLRAAAGDDLQLRALERAGLGLGHDELGAALCQRWGLHPDAVEAVARRLDWMAQDGAVASEPTALASCGEPPPAPPQALPSAPAGERVRTAARGHQRSLMACMLLLEAWLGPQANGDAADERLDRLALRTEIDVGRLRRVAALLPQRPPPPPR